MLEFFKKYCEFKNLSHKYGFMRVDANNKLFVETLKGDKITHLAYQQIPRLETPHFYYKYVDELVSISYATCGHTDKCQVGKPQQKCVDDGIYSPNKCAVIFVEPVDLENLKFNFNYTYKELDAVKEWLKSK